MEGQYRIVDFGKWCATCKYSKSSAFEDPCDECLLYPARIDSRRPEKWEEKDEERR